ncbi:MAG: DUF1573 domain-containing protein [Bacteroidetes bacterium]|nr:DUF1573 domain-containing protein [Bacteroidota bacterium]
MKKIVILLVTAISTGVVFAQQAPSNTGATTAMPEVKPETLVLKEPEFNFGKIPQGKPVTHVFELSNAGKDSIKIINVQASCGCTTPEWERDKPIPPGGTAKITVGYNAAAEGPFTKPVTITYNSTEMKQLFIKGEVWKTPSSSAPENKSLGDLKE